MMRKNDRRRRWTFRLIACVLLGVLAFSGSDLWVWVSTMDAGARHRVHGFTQVQLRALRFGKDRRNYHGPYRAERDGRLFTGHYDRGVKVGPWRVSLDGELIEESIATNPAGSDPRRDLDHLLGFDVLLLDAGRQWTLPKCCPLVLPCHTSRLVARKLTDDTILIGPARRGTSIERPFLELKPGGGVILVNSNNGVTEYNADRRIVAQYPLVDPFGELRRETTPWDDPLEGEPEAPRSPVPPLKYKVPPPPGSGEIVLPTAT